MYWQLVASYPTVNSSDSFHSEGIHVGSMSIIMGFLP